MRYKVTIEEIWIREFEVEAESIEQVMDIGDNHVETGFEFLSSDCPKIWPMAPVTPDILH